MRHTVVTLPPYAYVRHTVVTLHVSCSGVPCSQKTLSQDELDSAIIYDRDYGYDFFGFKTLERSYLLKINGLPPCPLPPSLPTCQKGARLP